MLRKVLLLLAVMFTFPVFSTANAWTLSTRALTVGGTLQVGTNTPQTNSNGTVSSTFAANVVVPLTLTPSPGYQISAVTINGVTQSLPLVSNPFNSGLVAYPGKNTQSVTVNFAKQLVSVTSSADNGGTVFPSGTSTNMVSSIANYTFTPNSGLNLVDVTGAPVRAAYTDLSVTPNVAVTLPAPINHTIRMSFTVPTSSVTFSGKFVGINANAGPPQSVLTGQAANLSGSATLNDGSASASYAWSQISGPAVGTLTNANMPIATFSSATNGTYTLRLVATSSNGASSTATTSVTVTNSAATAARNQCANCHANAGVGPTVYGNWSSSMHKVKVVVCGNCHIGANTGAHPGTLVSGTVNDKTFNYTAGGTNFCITCHSPAIITDFVASPHFTPAGSASCSFCHVQGVHNPNADCVDCHTPGNSLSLPWPPSELGFHTEFTSTNQCTTCHSLHNPAVVTFATYPHFSTYSTAQYVATNFSCDTCHKSTVVKFKVYSANRQWAKSSHADPVSPAFVGPGPYTEANLETYDFKFIGTQLPATPATTVAQDCVRCHTTTGYINYVTPLVDVDTDPYRLTSFSDIHAWGTPGDRTREMVACSACHNNTSGFDATFSRRTVGLMDLNNGTSSTYTNVVQAWYNYSSSTTKKIIRSKLYTNQQTPGNELGQSNICIACHSGTAAGDLIKQSASSTTCGFPAQINQNPSIVCRIGTGANGTLILNSGLSHPFWGNADFIDPHGMAAANIMFPDSLRAGYEFRTGASSVPRHSDINTGENGDYSVQGPCIGCHMTSPKKHTFSPISSASNGEITAITTNLCSNIQCHGGGGGGFTITGPGDVETKRAGYQASLTVITVQLAARGVYFNATKPPYFFTTNVVASQGPATRVINWNAPALGGQGAHLMGAAFNLRLHQSDAGWVHNPSASKKLLYDTIDYLDDANPSNNTVAGTIQTLFNTGIINKQVKDSATAYLVPRP